MHCPKGDIAANLATMRAHLRATAERGVDVILFPEMSLTGYIDPTRMPAAVLSLDGPEVSRFVELSAGHGSTVLAGLVEHNPAGKPFITQLAARNGSLLAVYRKITVIDEEAAWFSAGADLAFFTVKGVTCGNAICADIDNPTVFESYARQGAAVIFEAAAPGLYGAQESRDWSRGFQWWREECHTKLGTYARAHGIWIAVATQSGRTVDEDFPGGGYVCAPDGRCVAASADWTPGVLYADLPADTPLTVPI